MKGERLFEYLRRQADNEPFSEEVVRNWYIARAFVLDKLKNVSFAPGCNRHLHVVVEGDSPLMLAVLRQVVLSAHYPNFVEYDMFNRLVCKNRSVITLISDMDTDSIVRELEKEENLCNLLKICKYSVYGEVRNEDSFMDILLEIAHDAGEDADCVHLKEEDVRSFVEKTPHDAVFSIDTRRAVYAKRAYGLGVEIDNLPYEGIHNAGRYAQALDAFQFKVLKSQQEQCLFESGWDNDSNAVKLGLSNLFCADCFESRELAIKQKYPEDKPISAQDRKAIWERFNVPLSISEHSRWVVEKLILGFRPLNQKEKSDYGSLFGKRRSLYLKRLKNNAVSPAHIDLCSYRDLRRVDPDNLKYDSFLMLAIPMILDKTRK